MMNKVETIIEMQKYIRKIMGEISHEGEVDNIDQYGGSMFLNFKNGKTYRLNMSLYNNKVCLD